MNAQRQAWLAMVTGSLLAAALTLHLTGFGQYKGVLLIISTIFAGLPIIMRAVQSIRMKAFSIELLVSIAIIGALFIGEYIESAVVSFLFLFGSYLEARTLEKTRTSLRTLIDMAPQEATILRNGEKVTIAVDKVEKGDRVIIQSGEKVAVDGKVVAGTALINESAITGESVPANKQMDHTVFSGTIIDHGYIEVIAEKVGDDTAFAKIIELVEDAQESKTKTEKFLEKFAHIYTPAIMALSVIVFIFTSNIEFALTFLVIACPGALVISAPVSIVAGIGNGAKNGVLIKGGEIMEKLAKVNTIVFDKTGTLTQGQPAVTDIKTFSMNENDLLRIVAEAEVISEHHLGQTIVKEAKARNLTLSNEPKNAEVIKGNGIRALIAGNQLVIGNRKLMMKYQIDIASEEETYAITKEKQGNTTIFAAVNGKVEGIISIADQIRPEAIAALKKLRASGIKDMYMLTGDNKHTAELVAQKLDIEHVFAELLPEDKVNKIRKLKEKERHIAMAGDGINDAPAIATADIGLAMGRSGTDVSMETADVVLMADDLDHFAHAYSLAKATVRNMKQNTLFAVSTVVLLLIGVLMQKVFLASGMLIHELSVLLVILNAVRLVKFNNKKALK
ncbi:heavy metal translocating P-type ATPase [Lederbergia lenta]|uniref:Cd(2+)-exporting ATPase n=1 Tax=Lederbergia lenta TaxID=1467 RepID=A0A2X4W4J4_LEDLE|nr:cation-translocating P-type ATPase [Lederbergia lenta]MEC2323606.1 cation-translocating P-type ATPase [Lederbergia lenta]SQI52510.1 heavy metal translocating P-type ATPase [Lederbergia lenta]